MKGSCLLNLKALSDLGFLDGTYGAGVNASTTISASVSIDYVLVIALRDSIYGAGIHTCTAAGAIVINYVSHCCSSLIRVSIRSLYSDPLIY